jgi:hypothetical protein
MSSRQHDEARQTQQSNASRDSEPVPHSHRCAREGGRGGCLFTQRSKQAWTITPGRDQPGHGTTWQMPAARWWLLLLVSSVLKKSCVYKPFLSQKPSVEILKVLLNSLLLENMLTEVPSEETRCESGVPSLLPHVLTSGWCRKGRLQTGVPHQMSKCVKSLLYLDSSSSERVSDARAASIS